MDVSGNLPCLTQPRMALLLFYKQRSIDMNLYWSLTAVVDLNGRYFGGRVVKGNFYNLDKFRRLDLADPID